MIFSLYDQGWRHLRRWGLPPRTATGQASQAMPQALVLPEPVTKSWSIGRGLSLLIA